MNIKLIPKSDLKLADNLQQQILNPKHKKRYRSFGYITKSYYRNPSLFIGAYNKNKLIGIVFGHIKKEKILLGEMAISEKYRNKGIGSKLIKFFENKAEELNKKYIELGAFGDAERFYIKNKYTPILFAQIYPKDVLKDYSKLKLEIIQETNYKDAKRLWIKAVYLAKLKNKLKKQLNAYDVIYLFRKKL